MKLSNKELQEEFHESIREEYPDLTSDQIRDITFGPWRHLRVLMSSGSLQPMRIKYFGIFRVLTSRAKFMLMNMTSKYEAGNLSTEEFEEYKLMIEKYLENEEMDQ